MYAIADLFAWLLRQGVVRSGVLLGLPVVIIVVATVLLARSVDTQRASLRNLRVHEQRLQQQAARLNSADASERLVALEESREALQLRVLEALVDIRESPGTGELAYRIDERAPGESTGASGEGDAATLRLIVSGRLADGAVLIEWLDRLMASYWPWPGEVRGCQVQRLADAHGVTMAPTITALDARLKAECAIDVHHWSDLQVPRVH